MTVLSHTNPKKKLSGNQQCFHQKGDSSTLTTLQLEVVLWTTTEGLSNMEWESVKSATCGGRELQVCLADFPMTSVIKKMLQILENANVLFSHKYYLDCSASELPNFII